MVRLLALEWDAREARVVVAQRRRNDIAVEQAFAVELRAEGSPEIAGEADLGRALASALADRGLARTETLVAVGRTNIELRPLSLPPAPADELPDLVRFQALKQFSVLGDDWPLDFVPLKSENQTSVNVLAAAISTELVTQIRKACSAANLEPSRLVLRPFSAAFLLRKRRASEGCMLMVDVLADEADLTVVTDGNVEFIRTVRLPTSVDADEQVRQMIGELRRTIAAASNQAAGRTVEHIVVCGDSAEHAPLRSQIEQQLGLPVEYFDPFEGIALANDAQSIRPPHVGRYAPLLGMLVCEASGGAHDIDFLHPRRRPAPPNQRRRNAILAIAGSVVALGVTLYYWHAYADLASRIKSLNDEIRTLEGDSKRLEPVRIKTNEVDEFTANDVTWLEELRDVSEKFLPPEDAILSKLSLGPAPRGGGGGNMSFSGNVRSSTHLGQLESQLRNEHHKVDLGSGRYDDKHAELPWSFAGSIGVTTESAATTSPSTPVALTEGRSAR